MSNCNKIIPGRLTLAALLLSAVFLSGCGEDKKNETKDLTGVWLKEGYGEVWQISSTQIISYHHNKFGCVKNTEYPSAS
ncbi:MAG: hypothetical protein KKA56_01930, partial [Gammaproteobacteria bacterium]|nr:hypothetical protein [Gammaproteobacteria bacterium]